MGLLDGLLPGNRVVRANGVAVSPQNDTLDFVGAGVSGTSAAGVTTITINPAGLTAGSYAGQPLVWDGSTWAPASGFIGISIIGPLPTNPSQSVAIVGGNAGIGVNNGDVALQTGHNANVITFAVRDKDDVLVNAMAFAHGNLEAGNTPLIGVFSKAGTPAPQQTITGATTQQQVDSIVLALVNLGWVVDVR